MLNFAREEYLQAFNEIPEGVNDMLLSENTAEAVENLTQRYNVEADKIFDVSAIIGYAMVGLVPIKRFIDALQSEAGLDAETARNVAHDVRAEIFAPVAKELADMQEKAEENWQKAAQEAKKETETSRGEKDNDVKDEKKPESHHKDESVTRKIIE
ncbi:MAG: hypothetical protein WD712_01195 [Candidatus Spechtbacterales bacterium]